jgi:hypothetical protein
MFTKQHYKAIAKIISDSRSIDRPDFLYRDEVIQAFIEMFADDNELFNEKKFRFACNVKYINMMSIS